MKKVFFKRSQALIEVAILGPVLLVAVGLVATYVAKLNNDHWILMSAFRNALQKAHDTNEIVSYGTFDDRRMVSVNEPILGQKTTSSASAQVHWAIKDVSEGSSDNTAGSASYMKINGGAIPGLYEYKIEGGGGVEPTYLTFKSSRIVINRDQNITTTRRSGGVGEVMIYKVGEQYFVQARGHGASREHIVNDE